MPHYLLTRAGFSRNWGGWLAEEALEYLLGCSELTPNHRNLLWKHRALGSGFEGVLDELRSLYIQHRDAHSARELETFNKLLIGMFGAMNTHFGDFEPGKHEHMGPQPTGICDFLCRFARVDFYDKGNEGHWILDLSGAGPPSQCDVMRRICIWNR